VQRRAEQVDTVPASERLARHAFLNGVDVVPGRIGWTCQADTFPAVAQASEAFVGDALVRRTPIGAGMAEAAVRHIPAMQQRARGQGIVPGKGRQATGGALVIDQLEELLGELPRLAGYRRRPIGSGQGPVLRRNQRCRVAVGDAV